MSLPFRPVDVEAQARALRLEERGSEDGSHNRPRSDSDIEANTELEVKGAIDADRERCLLDLSSHLRAYRDALAQLQTAMDVAGMRQAADEATSEFNAIKVRFGSRVKELSELRDAYDAEYNNFRLKHRLTRTPRQPKDRTFTAVLACSFVVFEGVLNSYFFSSTTEGGLIGGAVIAVVASAVNIGLAILNGWFPLRWMRHRRIYIKSLGLLSFVGLFLISLFLNVFVAHYRDIAEASTDAPSLPAVFTSVISDPAGLHSIQSLLLFVIGVALAGYAMAKGFHLDDPYPGYGATDRRRTAARVEYEEIRQELLDTATEVRDIFLDKLRVKIETLRASSTQRQQILAARVRSISQYKAHEANLADAAQQLLSIYRHANVAARSTPPPAHFQRRFAFPDRGAERPEIQALLHEQGLEIDAEGLIRELDTLRQRVLATCQTLMQEAPE
jgi:hypothetical protein